MNTASRNTDPLSSHIAESDITTSGERKRQADIVLEAIKKNPGKTSKELQSLCSLDRYQIARRTNDLYIANLVKKIEHGTDELKWYIADLPSDANTGDLSNSACCQSRVCIEIKNRHVSGLVQVNLPCSSCGSYYRCDGKCNICG